MTQHADSVLLVPHFRPFAGGTNSGGTELAVTCGGYACAAILMNVFRVVPDERKRYADDHEERTC